MLPNRSLRFAGERAGGPGDGRVTGTYTCTYATSVLVIRLNGGSDHISQHRTIDKVDFTVLPWHFVPDATLNPERFSGQHRAGGRGFKPGVCATEDAFTGRRTQPVRLNQPI